VIQALGAMVLGGGWQVKLALALAVGVALGWQQLRIARLKADVLEERQVAVLAEAEVDRLVVELDRASADLTDAAAANGAMARRIEEQAGAIRAFAAEAERQHTLAEERAAQARLRRPRPAQGVGHKVMQEWFEHSLSP
jgi:hypothetical protein